MANWYAKSFRKGRNSFVKYYNGIEWIKKPIKFYDGSSWTTRNGSPNQLRSQNMIDPTATTALGATKYWNGTSWQVIDALSEQTYTITPSTTSINEGGTVTFTISATAPEETLYYEIRSYFADNSISSYDFGNMNLTGTLVAGSNSTATLTVPITSDIDTELAEYFYIEIYSQFNGSKGDYESQSPIITINDTSAPANPTSGNFLQVGEAPFVIGQSRQWSIRAADYINFKSFAYTFPSNTPLGHYYMVFWNGINEYNTTTTTQNRWVCGLHVTESFKDIIATASPLNIPEIPSAQITLASSGSTGGIGPLLVKIEIINTTTGEVTNLMPGNGTTISHKQFAFYEKVNTLRVSPGDSIFTTVYVVGSENDLTNPDPGSFRYGHFANT